MMPATSPKNLITRSGLDEINLAASGLVENLLTHINGSLSKQHGWNLVLLPDPTFDSAGNNITLYRDSGGDVWGNYRLQLTYNKVHYYIPLQTTGLPGKPPVTAADLFPNISEYSDTASNRAWITDFTASLQAVIQELNSNLLLNHAQKTHWEVHASGYYQVTPKIVRDSAGHRVSNYVARIIFEGRELWLPCDSLIGGPHQPVRLPRNAVTTLRGTRHNYVACANDDDQWGFFYAEEPVGGTKPYTLTWEYNTYIPTRIGGRNFWQDPSIGTGNWEVLPLNLGNDIELPALQASNGSTSTRYRHFDNGRILKITTSTVANHKRIAAVVRARWSNPAGTVYSNWAMMEFQDTDGSWFFSDPASNQSTFHVPIANDPQWANGYFTPPPISH